MITTTPQGRDPLLEALRYNFPDVETRVSFNAVTKTVYVDYISKRVITKQIEDTLKNLGIESFKVQRYKEGWNAAA